MKRLSDGSLKEFAYPILLLNNDLSFRYANNAARSKLGILCRMEGARPFIKEDLYTEVVRKISDRQPVFLENMYLTNYATMLLIPISDGDRRCVLVFAEDTLSVFTAVEGHGAEKEISELFAKFESIPVERILELCRGVRRYIKTQDTVDLSIIKKHIDSIEDYGNNLLQISSYLLASTRLMTMMNKYGLSFINLNEFFQQFKNVEIRNDAMMLETINKRILFDEQKLKMIVDNIFTYIKRVGTGPIQLSMRAECSHIVLKFHAARVMNDIKPIDAFKADSKMESLFIARSIVERSGGNMMVRFGAKNVMVYISFRILSPVNYGYYLAQDWTSNPALKDSLDNWFKDPDSLITD